MNSETENLPALLAVPKWTASESVRQAPVVVPEGMLAVPHMMATIQVPCIEHRACWTSGHLDGKEKS